MSLVRKLLGTIDEVGVYPLFVFVVLHLLTGITVVLILLSLGYVFGIHFGGDEMEYADELPSPGHGLFTPKSMALVMATGIATWATYRWSNKVNESSTTELPDLFAWVVWILGGACGYYLFRFFTK